MRRTIELRAPLQVQPVQWLVEGLVHPGDARHWLLKGPQATGVTASGSAK